MPVKSDHFLMILHSLFSTAAGRNVAMDVVVVHTR